MEEQLVSQIGDRDEDLLVEMYRQMKQIREFEIAAGELVRAGEIPGPIHPYIGQEAIAVGTCTALDDEDIIGSTHRGHGHVLAKGADLDGMMAELTAREAGLNRGRGGSMHMVDFSLGIFGCNAIVGASVPHVAGGMLSGRIDGDDRVGVSFFGEGAINQGVVHETMNMAAIWDLPVIFVCENNKYAVSTDVEYAAAGDSLASRGEAYGIESRTITGQNVLTVHETISEAVDDARAGEGPQFVECETYRYKGHFSGEEAILSDRSYRSDEEIRDWKENRDPIETFGEALVESGRVDAETLREIDDEIDEEVSSAVDLATESDLPSGDRAPENAYADQEYPAFPAPKYR
jgi:TPP-dependent pyruvate/acetoin dehydrogenase alpha subunit